MEAGLIGLIIQLLSGAAGGNVVGAIFKNLSLGTAGNSIAGILGGGIGGFLLQQIGLGGGGGMDLAGIASQVAGGGVGGGVLMMVIGAVKKMMSS